MHSKKLITVALAAMLLCPVMKAMRLSQKEIGGFFVLPGLCCICLAAGDLYTGIACGEEAVSILDFVYRNAERNAASTIHYLKETITQKTASPTFHEAPPPPIRVSRTQRVAIMGLFGLVCLGVSGITRMSCNQKD